MRFVAVNRLILGVLTMGPLSGCGASPDAAVPAPPINRPIPVMVTQTRSCDDHLQSVTVAVGDLGRPHATRQAAVRAFALLAQEWLDQGQAAAAWRCVQEALPEAQIDDDDPAMLEARALLAHQRIPEAAARAILRLNTP